jgi:hypothetical protein
MPVNNFSPVAPAMTRVQHKPLPSVLAAAPFMVLMGAITVIKTPLIIHSPTSETFAMAPVANKRDVMMVVLIALAADRVVIIPAIFWVPAVLGSNAALIRTGSLLGSLHFSRTLRRALGSILSQDYGYKDGSKEGRIEQKHLTTHA